MKTMNMPGFTAEASLYKTSKHYSMAATLEGVGLSSTLYPQMRRATGPSGPIGFPGQDCGGACWHLCKMTGGGEWFFDHCMNSCQSSCSQPSFNARM